MLNKEVCPRCYRGTIELCEKKQKESTNQLKPIMVLGCDECPYWRYPED